MRRLLVCAAAALVGLSGACGDGDGSDAAPPRAPTDLVPARLLNSTLGIFEHRKPSSLKAFANAGPTSLVADTRVWEIRRGDRLVATLQISTVLPKVDLRDEEVRERFARQVLLGPSSRIRSGDVEVFIATANDKTVMLWFGANLFEVVQTKDRELKPEALLDELIKFQNDKPGWKPLPQLADFETT